MKPEIIKALADPTVGVNRVAISMQIKADRLPVIYGIISETADGLPANEAYFVAEILKRICARLDNETEKIFAGMVIGGWMEKTFSKKSQNKNMIIS